jgi:hypothetical protein
MTDETGPKPEDRDPPVAAPEAGERKPDLEVNKDDRTCTSIIPEIVELSTNGGTIFDLAIIDVYRPEVLQSHVQEYRAGTFKVLPDKTSVDILSCKGLAKFADLSETPIVYGVQVDEKGAFLLQYQPAETFASNLNESATEDA